jgi:hypothetical protein
MAGDSSSAPKKGGSQAASSRGSPWHAVSIVPGRNACPAVRELGRKRWLSAEAPRFPVAGCTAAVCDCRYKHHADRRAKPRRGSDREEVTPPRGNAAAERRSRARDRRKV